MHKKNREDMKVTSSLLKSVKLANLSNFANHLSSFNFQSVHRKQFMFGNLLVQ